MAVRSGVEHHVAWGRLEQLNSIFSSKVRSAFQNPGSFILTLTGEDDTLSLVEGEMVGLLKPDEMQSLAKSVWSWANKFRSAEGRMLRDLHDAVERGPYLVAVPRVDPCSVYQSLISSDPLSGLASLENHLKATKQLQSSTSRQAKEEAVKKKWLLKLTAFMIEARLPAVSRIQALPDPASAWSRAFGSRRGGTLKNRALAWEQFYRWLEQSYGTAWPSGAGVILQYFQERFEGGTLFKTTPPSFLASLMLLEQVGQVTADQRLSTDSLVESAVKSWTTELEQGSRPVRQAPMFTIAILMSLEMTLARTNTDNGLRFACFMVLLMVWGALRCDDLQSIDPATVSFSQLGLKFLLHRTKTSGPGKKQGALQGFVLRGVSLTGYDWLAAGYQVLQLDDYKFPRDFLCVHLDERWQVASRSYLEPEGVASLVRAVLRSLHVPHLKSGTWGLSKTAHLVPQELILFWSGHSPRHVLPSLAAAVGVPQPKIDFLGRWSVAKSASSTYVQTSRQVVHQIQAQICTAILEGCPAPGLVEEELLQQITQFVSAQGGNGNQVAALHSVLSWNSPLGAWSLKGIFPAISVDPQSHARATADASTLQVEPDNVTEDAPFFVTVSRSGFRRLHVSHACAVRQERCLEWRPIQIVTTDCADAVCKLCKPKLDASRADSSQSASASESAGEQDS